MNHQHPLASLVLLGCVAAAPVAVEAGVMQSYRHGVDGYAGTADTWINSLPSGITTNNGGGNVLAVRMGNRTSTSQDDNVGEMFNSMLSFGDLGIAPGTEVGSATLKLTIDAFGADGDDNAPVVLDVFEVVRPWTEGGATWNNAASGVAWGIAGAKEAGVDRSPLPIASVTVGDRAVGDVVSIEIPAEVMQAWVDGTAGHHGLLLRLRDEPYDYFQVNFRSSEHADVTSRPELVLNVIPEPAGAAAFVGLGGALVARRAR